MSSSTHDQQRVFLAYRAYFNKQNSSSGKKRKKIAKLVRSHEQSMKPLVECLGNKRIVAILQGLLERGVFSSESQAKVAFPSLFPTSAAQGAQHSASKSERVVPQDGVTRQVQSLDEHYLAGDCDLDNCHIFNHGREISAHFRRFRLTELSRCPLPYSNNQRDASAFSRTFFFTLRGAARTPHQDPVRP